jgi:hypothetical protein
MPSETIRAAYQTTNSLSRPRTGLKKVTRWVIERGMLGQYQRARGLLYLPEPPPQPTTKLDYDLGTAGNSDLQG